jgi:WD40 repeat protein
MNMPMKRDAPPTFAAINNGQLGADLTDARRRVGIGVLLSLFLVEVLCVACDSVIRLPGAGTAHASELGAIRIDEDTNLPISPMQIGTNFPGLDLPTGAIRQLGSNHFRAPNTNGAIAYSIDGTLLASASTLSPYVDLWDANTGRHLRSFKTPIVRHPPRLSFSSDGKRLTVYGGSLTVFNLDSGQLLHHLSNQGQCSPYYAISLDGRTVARADNEYRKNGPIIIWDLKDKKEVGRLPHDEGDACALVFSRDGKKLASGGPWIRVWDLATGQTLRVLEREAGTCDTMDFSPDGTRLLSTTFKGIKCWDIDTGKLLYELPPDAGAINSELQFSKDGRYFITGTPGRAICLRDGTNGKQIRTWCPHAEWPTSLAFSPDGKSLASVARLDFGIRRWDLMTGNEIEALQGHTGRISAFGFSKDSQSLYSLSDGDKRVRKWDLATGISQGDLFDGPIDPDPEDAFWRVSGLSPDGKTVAFMPGRSDAGRASVDVIRLVNTRTGKQAGVLRVPKNTPQWLTFSSDARFLASSTGMCLQLWDLATLKELQRYENRCRPVFSSDGRILGANSFERDREIVELIDVGSGKSLFKLHNEDLRGSTCFVLSPDGQYIVFPSVDGSAKLCSAKDGKLLKNLQRNNPLANKSPNPTTGIETKRLSDPVFSRTGRILATVTHDGGLTLWDMISGAEIRHIATGEHEMEALAFSPCDRILVTGGADSRILLWDLTGHYKAGQVVPPQLTLVEQKANWLNLGEDPAKAESAYWAFALSPATTLAFLRERLLAKPDPKELAGLISLLDHVNFAVRDKASKRLAELGPAAGKALQEAIARSPTAEKQQRVQRILEKHEPEIIRGLRCVDILEHMNTSESWTTIDEILNIASDQRIVQAASLALRRRAK